MVRRIVDRVSGLGVLPGMAAAEAKHVRFCNAAAALASVLATIFAFAEMPLIIDLGISGAREWSIVAVRFFECLPFVAPLILNSRGRYAVARRLLAGWGIVFCLGQTVLYGPTAPSHVLFLPIVATLFALFPRSERRAMWWSVAAAGVGLGACVLLRHLDRPLVPVTFPVIRVVNDVAVTFGALVFAGIVAFAQRTTTEAAEARVVEEQEKAERLLLNILPAPIAKRLKESEGSIADGFDEVTVMFADLVGFTPLSAKLSPRELVELMDRVFSEFDRVVERHGLEKIKTIGDAYMVAGGLPEPTVNHTEAVADMALDLIPIIAATESPTGDPLSIRVGVARGAVVAGVIGRTKFSYDLWGDTVNTASRLESHGEPGRIQVDEAVWHRLRDRYLLEERGEINLKGKGRVRTWFLEGRR